MPAGRTGPAGRLGPGRDHVMHGHSWLLPPGSFAEPAPRVRWRGRRLERAARERTGFARGGAVHASVAGATVYCLNPLSHGGPLETHITPSCGSQMSAAHVRQPSNSW
jgi:hypothetical protein